MQTLSQYIERTSSAAQILFDGLAKYRATLTEALVDPLVVSYSDDEDLEFQTREWASVNEEAITRQKEAFTTFAAETFSQATLAGAILQLASAAIEQYGQSRPLGPVARKFVPPSKSQFWAGRTVRGLPLGTIILAGRNQHMHSSDEDFNPCTTTVFAHLATAHGFAGYETTSEPGLDLAARDRGSPLLRSFAHNILFLTGWKEPADMRKDLSDIIGSNDSISALT